MSGSVPSLNVYSPGVGVYPSAWANTVVQGGCTLATLRAFSGVTNMTVMMVGYTAINDGGQGLFVWVSEVGAADDGGVTIIIPNGSTLGYWERITSAGTQGPAGPAGPTGPQGPPGPATTGPITQTLTGHYYQNEGASIDRLADRVLVGGATVSEANDPFTSPGNVAKDWLGVLQAQIGLNPSSEATLVSLQAPGDSGLGNIGLLGGAQSISFTNPAQSAIGVAGYAYNNSALRTAGWAFYGESYRLTETSNNTYGFELAVIQQSGTEHPITPYGGGTPGVAIGLQLDSGNGFSQTQQPGLCAASVGLALSQNTTDNTAPFLRGIVFFNNSLRTTSGVSEAISFYQGNTLQWYIPSGSAGSAILSQTSTIAGSTNINMLEGSLQIGAPATGSVLTKFTVVPNSVNYLTVTPNTTGNSPTLAATGADTNVNLVLTGKGTGFIVSAGNIQPQFDNTASLGVSGARWTSVWATNGTIQTSDPTLKTDIQPLQSMLPIIAAINPVTFRWKVGGRKPVTSQTWVDEDVYEDVTEDAEDHEIQPDGSVHLVTKSVTTRRQVFDYAPVIRPDGTPVIDQVPVHRKGHEVTYRAIPRTHPIPRKRRVSSEQTNYVEAPGNRTHWGFLAPDVRAGMAQTGLDFGGYVKDDDGVEHLRPDQLIPVLWKSVQELVTQMTAMKAEIAALTGNKSP